MSKSTTSRKPRTPAPEGETKSIRFSRLATARVTKICKQIRLLGNLSGSGYESTAEQVSKMETAIRDATKTAMARFDKSASKAADTVQI